MSTDVLLLGTAM